MSACVGDFVVGRLRPAKVSPSSPRGFVPSGQPSDTAPILPDLLGVRQITRERGRSPVGDVAADSAAKLAGPDFFSRTSTGPAAVNFTGGKGFNSGIGICSRLRRTFPLSTAAFANCIIYRLNHVKAILKFSRLGDPFVGIISCNAHSA